MKINDIIRIKSAFKGMPEGAVGKIGFIEENEELINGIMHHVVIIIEDDGVPFGNGPVPISSLEITDDPKAIEAFKRFNDSVNKIMEQTKVIALEIDKGLLELSKKHDITVAKLRAIYSDVFELTKGLINDQNKTGKEVEDKK